MLSAGGMSRRAARRCPAGAAMAARIRARATWRCPGRLARSRVVAGGDQPRLVIPQAAGDAGQQADQRPVGCLRDPAGCDRAGYLAGVRGGGDAAAGACASGDERLQAGPRFAWPQGDPGACCPEVADFALRGGEVAGRGLHVEQGGLQQRRHHLLRDAGRGVLPRDAPPGDLVGGAARPGGEPEPVGEERPVRGEVLHHAGLSCGGVGAAFPPARTSSRCRGVTRPAGPPRRRPVPAR